MFIILNQPTISFMAIEDDIKTKKFQNHTQKAHINVIFTANVIVDRIKNSLKPFDITQEQFNILRIIRGQGATAIRAKDISSRMLSRCSNTTRIIDRLEEKQYIARLEHQADRRERHLLLTPEGIRLLNAIEKHWEENSPHVASLDEQELILLNDLLDRLRSPQKGI